MNNEANQQPSSLHFLDYWRVISSRKELILAVAFLVVLTGTVYTLLLPNIYASSSRTLVSEDSPEINPFAVQQNYMSTYNPYFLRTQFEILTSKPILNEVIYRLNLQSEWGKNNEILTRDIALKILKNSISVFQQRDTSLIVINVKRDNPDEAADIANEIAQVYRDSRLELASKSAREAIDKIEESLTEQRQRVANAEENIQKIREDLNIAVVGGEGQFDVGEVRMQQLEGDRLFAQREMVEKEGLLRILEDLNDKDLLERASYITFDQFVMNTIQQIQDIEVNLSSVQADYGDNHPEVKRLKSQIVTLEETLKKRLSALRNGLDTEYIIAKNNFESLDKVLASVRTDTIESQGAKFRPYRNALADLETERFIYNQLMSKHRKEIITLPAP